MPRDNRVLPDGNIVSAPERGMFWGNRGALHDPAGNLVRYSRGKGWVICLLEFKGRRRTLRAPGRLTELFFVDEATALAAGHRPCAKCQSRTYRRFKDAWAAAHPGQLPSAPRIDAMLHADRLSGPATRRTYQSELARLPDGAMILLLDQAWLVLGDELLAWSLRGYHERLPRTTFDEVTVLTPRSTVATLAAGYRPKLHPSAER